MKRIGVSVGVVALFAFAAWANSTTVLENGETIVVFDQVGEFSWTAPCDIPAAEVLIVGGGGGGGCGGAGGGGGGGQVIHKTNVSLVGGQVYSGSVGSGGTGGTNGGASKGRWEGSNGVESVFLDLTALGGGGGGGHAGSAIKTGVAGGNSGGASPINGSYTSPDATGMDDPANGWYGGHKGGDSVGGTYSGGGGGAMGEGGSGYKDTDGLNHSGNGGDGYECAITGATVYYGCGGGGGCNGGVSPPYTLTLAGGDGGSGNASGGEGAKAHYLLGGAATNGTGSGGGGGGWNTSSPTVGGNGGSGIVVIRYAATQPIVEVEGFVGFADGEAHGVAVNVRWPATGTTVEYSADGEAWSADKPAGVAAFGESVGYVRVSAPGTELDDAVIPYAVRIKDPSAENDGTFHFVAPAGASTPTAPYATWETAANDIESAVAAANAAGHSVLIAPGSYSPTATISLQANDITLRSCRPADGLTDVANTVVDGSQVATGSLIKNDAKLRPVFAGLSFRNCGAGADNGGAIYLKSAGAYTVRGCRFTDNTALRSGGAIYSSASVGGRISDCAFVGNTATATQNDGSGGGAVYAAMNSSASAAEYVTIQDCTFSNNYAQGAGPNGGALRAPQNIHVLDCLFASNVVKATANSGRGGSLSAGHYSIVSNTTFTGWHGSTYGIVAQLGTECRLVDCQFTDLDGTGSYGAVHFGTGTVAEKCRFTGCKAAFDMFMTESSGAVIRNCLMANCTAGNFLRVHGAQTLRSEHCTFAGNDNACKIFANSSSGTKNVVVNCIYAGAGGPENSASHTYVVTNSVVSQATKGATDSGVIVTTDPGFRSVARGDCRLKADSVCVDAGIDLGWTATGRDLADDPRTVGAAPDIGCYERQAGEVDPFYGVKVVATEDEKTGDWADATTDVAGAVETCLDGETVLFKSGTYALTAPIALTDRSLLFRADVPGEVVLDAQGARRCLDVTLTAGNQTLTFDGLVFRNGFSGLDYSDANHNACGGGVYLNCGNNMSRIVCRNCRIENCRTVYDWSKGSSQNYARGGGAYVNGYCTLENCIVDSCIATNGFGGGVYTGSSRADQVRGIGPLFEECMITNCSSVGQGGVAGPGSQGAGMYCANHCWIDRCSFIGNVAVVTNSSGYAGGLQLGSGGVVLNTAFVNNKTPNYGGAIRLAGNATVSNCTFNGNSGNFGSLCDGNATTRILYCSFADDKGSAYFTTGAAPYFRNCLFACPGQTAINQLQNTGVLRAENCTFANCGTAISLGSNGQSDSLVNCLFSNNGKDFSTGKLEFAGEPFALTNCCFAAYPTVAYAAKDCVLSASARFRDAAHGDYSIKHASPARDKAMRLDWMTLAARDLAGNPRVVTEQKTLDEDPNALPDIGCYENQDVAQGMLMILR